MDERAGFDEMTTAELVSYRNILLMGKQMFQITDDVTRNERHLRLVEEILTSRGVTLDPDQLLWKSR